MSRVLPSASGGKCFLLLHPSWRFSVSSSRCCKEPAPQALGRLATSAPVQILHRHRELSQRLQLLQLLQCCALPGTGAKTEGCQAKFEWCWDPVHQITLQPVVPCTTKCRSTTPPWISASGETILDCSDSTLKCGIKRHPTWI